MSTHGSEDGINWVPAWTQAVSDFRGEDDEPPFDDVTVRMKVPASIGGDRVRVELSNRFGDDPVRIGRGAVGIGDRFVEIAVGGEPWFEIPAGQTSWTDPTELAIGHGDVTVVDLYLPEPTPYATAGGFSFDRSVPGDFAGSPAFPVAGSTPGEIDDSREFPAANTGPGPEPDGMDWSLPAGGPFLRAVEVAGIEAEAVIVAFGASSTAMGWPQYSAGMLASDDRIAIVNRGIPGNRIRLDAPPQTSSWGRAGLSRFDEDVLRTDGATHVVVAYNSNDWGLPGRITAEDGMPTLDQMIDAYRELIKRAEMAGLQVILATVTPLDPELAVDRGREGLRRELNGWIRARGGRFLDFDAAIRSKADPSRLDERYAAPDHTHPNVNGQKRLARAMVDAIAETRFRAT